MRFLFNHWYAAAWSYELTQGLVSRVILGRRVTLFRAEDGTAVMVDDLCPHRFAPLHLGRIVSGTIECPYHGLRFDKGGRCVANPDGGHLPRAAQLRTYPVIELGGCVWMWPGDPERADAALLPDFAFFEEPEIWCPVLGYLHVGANYQLCIDNVLDAAHVRMVHRHSLYCEKLSDAKTVLKRDADGSIWANRFVEATPPPPVFDMMWRASRGDYDGLMDHWLDARWIAPSIVADDIGVTLHGRSRRDGIETKATHFFTPETETTSHYFWGIIRNFNLDNTELSANIKVATEHAFIHEDEVMLRAVQLAMGERDFFAMKPALLPADAGSVEARRALDRLIRAERDQAQHAA